MCTQWYILELSKERSLFMNWLVEHYNLIMIIGVVVWTIYFVVLVVDDLKGAKNDL